MSRFQLREIRLENYRCFDEFRLTLEEDATVIICGEWRRQDSVTHGPRHGPFGLPARMRRTQLKLDVRRDPRMRTLEEKGGREPAGPCEVEWTATVCRRSAVHHLVDGGSALGLRTEVQVGHRPILEAIERVRAPGDRWPLFAWYGVDRLGRQRGRRRKIERSAETGGKGTTRRSTRIWMRLHCSNGFRTRSLETWSADSREEPERFLHQAVIEATVRVTPWRQERLVRSRRARPEGALRERARSRVLVRTVGRLPCVHRTGSRHRPSRRYAQRIRWRRSTRTRGGRSAHRRARPAPPSAMAAHGSTATSRSVPEATVRRLNALATGAEQC